MKLDSHFFIAMLSFLSLGFLDEIIRKNTLSTS